MGQTSIEWTEHSWNPIVGCSKQSIGCENCYALRMAVRLAHNPKLPDDVRERYASTVRKTTHGWEWSGKVALFPERLDEPLRRRKPTRYFVPSMGDLFHEDVAFEIVSEVFEVMESTPRHKYQVLTKRPQRMLEFANWMYRENNDASVGLWWDWAKNIWAGVSVENQAAADERIPWLLQTPAAVRFVSCEPLLEAVDISPYLDYNIQKGETGNGKRADFVRSDHVGRMENRSGGLCLDDKRGCLEKSRTQAAPGLPSGQKNDQGRSSSHGGAPSHLSPLQRDNSARYDDQPYQRQERRQQTGEPRTGNLLREHETCIQDWSEKPGWTKESCQQTDRSASPRDQGAICTGRNNTARTGEPIRGILPNSIQDSEKRTPSSPGWKNSRLYRTSNEQAKGAKPKGAISSWGAWSSFDDLRYRRRECWLDVRGQANPTYSAMMQNPIKLYRLGKKAAGRLLDGREWSEMPGQEVQP